MKHFIIFIFKEFGMKKIAFSILMASVVFASLEASAAPSTLQKVKFSYKDKQGRICTVEQYSPKNATCNKEKMDSKYFITTAPNGNVAVFKGKDNKPVVYVKSKDKDEYHLATNGGNADDDGHTVSCVKA
jgi:hypothetical protein